jgi:hypothetical protein
MPVIDIRPPSSQSMFGQHNTAAIVGMIDMHFAICTPGKKLPRGLGLGLPRGLACSDALAWCAGLWTAPPPPLATPLSRCDLLGRLLPAERRDRCAIAASNGEWGAYRWEAHLSESTLSERRLPQNTIWLYCSCTEALRQ